MSKGTQMRKFRTFKEAAQKIVIKKPWGVEVKSYKAGDPIPAGVEFKIFDANDTAKIEAYADGLDESADYQKERFKEPYYMYNESKKVVENKMVGIISLPVGSKFIDDSFGGKRTLEVVKHGNDDVIHVKEVGTGRKFAYDASTPGGNKKVEKIEEGRIVKESKFPGKVVKLGSLKPGDKFVFAIPGIYDDKIDGPRFDIVKKVDKVLDLVYWYPGGNTKYEHSSPARTEVIPAKYMKESLSSKTHKFKPEELKVGKRVIDKVGGHEVHGKITVNHHDLYKDNPYTQDKKGSTVVTITTDKGRSYDVDANDNGGEFILEGRIAKGYENLDADEKARHLLSHPTSKYMSDLKSENITERAIRKAVKEMLGKPAKDDPEFIADVNEDVSSKWKKSIYGPDWQLDDGNISTKISLTHSGDYIKRKWDTTTGKQIGKTEHFNTKEEAMKESKINPIPEEGEAPAIANTTAEVANPDLPLKLKEGENSWEMGNGDKIEVKSDVVIRTTKDGKKFMMSRKEWENGDSSNREPNWRKMKEATKVPYLLKNAKVGDTFHDGSDLGREYKITRVTPSKVYATCVKDPNTTGEYNRSHSDFNETDPQWAKLYTIKY